MSGIFWSFRTQVKLFKQFFEKADLHKTSYLRYSRSSSLMIGRLLVVIKLGIYGIRIIQRMYEIRATCENGISFWIGWLEDISNPFSGRDILIDPPLSFSFSSHHFLCPKGGFFISSDHLLRPFMLMLAENLSLMNISDVFVFLFFNTKDVYSQPIIRTKLRVTGGARAFGHILKFLDLSGIIQNQHDLKIELSVIKMMLATVRIRIIVDKIKSAL